MPTIKVYITLALLLLSSGCAVRSSTGKINFNASTTATILSIEATYETILKGLGDAYRDGLISRPVLERGRRLGNKAEKAITTAKDVTAAYLRGGGAQSPVFAALASLTTLMVDLERFYLDVTGKAEVLQ